MSCFTKLIVPVLLCSGVFSTPVHAMLAGDPAGSPPDSPAQRVDPNTASSPWAGVGSILVGDKSFSAALIGPRHILTAAHVVSGAEPTAVSFVLHAGSVVSQRIDARAIHVNPGYQGFVPAADGIVHDDLAIVELSQPAPQGVPYYTPFLGETTPGTVLTFVGYGATGDGVNGVSNQNAPNTKRVGRNAADMFALDEDGSGLVEAFLFDFDGPDASTNRFGGLTLGNQVETTFAGGDSGSPALLQVDGRWQLAGVATFVSHFKDGPSKPGVFGTGGGGMLLSGYAAWIHSTVGEVPPVSPVPEPVPSAMWLPGLMLVGLITAWRRRFQETGSRNATNL